MRSVDADSGVCRLDLPQDPRMIEALIAANRARIAELKTLPAGGVNSLGDFAVSVHGMWVLAELAVTTAGTVVIASLVSAGVLPLAFLGLCVCMVMKIAMLVIALALGITRGIVLL